MPIKYGPLDHDHVWAHYAEGQLPAEIGRSMGRPPDAIYALIDKAGGIKPAARVRSSRQLSLAEREEISRGLAAGRSCRAIAAGLGRSPSTITREVARNGGRARYRALRADRAAWNAALRSKGPNWQHDPRCDNSCSNGCDSAGRQSRSPVGSGENIPTIRSGGCRTRRSTGRCACRPKAR